MNRRVPAPTRRPARLTAAAVAAAILAAAPAPAGTVMGTAVIREGTLPPAVTAAGGRDPFNWPPKQEKRFAAVSRKKTDPLAAVRLDGIIYSRARPLAVINGRVFATGEEIAGYRISAITRGAVLLRRGRVSRELRLPMPVLRVQTTGKGEK